MSGNPIYEMYDEDLPADHVGIGIRHLQALLMFMVLLVGYTMRSAMGVAILAMTDNTNENEVEVFQWDKQTQDMVMSAFYWGYTIMQIPSAVLAHRLGGWFLLINAMAVNCLASIATPWIAHYGDWQAVCAVRMLQGLTQSAIFPCLHTLLGKWIPLSERGRIGNFVYCGMSVGTVISMPFAGILAATSIGWPSIFYAGGILAFIVAVLSCFLGSNDPAKDKRISAKERKYIDSSSGLKSYRPKVCDTPWKKIFTSPPMIALMLTHIGFNWMFLTVLMETPSYMTYILNIDVQQSGLLSGLPYLANWFIGIIASFINDYLINSGICSVSSTRKIMNSIASWLSAIFLVSITFLPEGSNALAVTFVTMIIGLMATNSCGFMVNHLDLSPNFAGILMGITNCLANLFSIGAPILAGYILNNHERDISKWRTVFIISSAVGSISNLIFVLFASGDVQDWDSATVFKGQNDNTCHEVEMIPLSDQNQSDEKEKGTEMTRTPRT